MHQNKNDLSDRLADLSPEKRYLLLQKLKRSRGLQTAADTTSSDKTSARKPEQVEAVESEQQIPFRSETQDRFPVSFSQLREWILDRFDPGTSAYNLASPLRLEGALDLAALRSAADRLVARHEALRTVFEAGEVEPFQKVLPFRSRPIPLIDLSALRTERRQSEADRWTRIESGRGFDLSAGPLIRFVLLRLAVERHRLLITMHHIVSDGWSMGVISRELDQLYRALSKGEEAELPALPIQYPDFALWQRQRLRGELLERLLGYWRQQLDGPRVFDLPTDRPRPTVRSELGARYGLALSEEATSSARRLVRHGGGTLFMALVSTLQALFFRYTQGTDHSIGTYIANRTRTETAHLIGFFVNTLVLRTRFGASDSMEQLFRQVKRGTLDAYAHQDLPFEKLLDALQPPRDPSRTPFFQTLCVLQNTPRSEAVPGSLQLLPLEGGQPQADFDLSFWFSELEGQLSLSIAWRVSLFDRTTIQRLAKHFSSLLISSAHALGSPLRELAFSTASEQHQLLCEWSRNEHPHQRESARVDYMILSRAQESGDAICISAEGEQITHRRLVFDACILAASLRERGLHRGETVAVSCARSPRTIAAFLGILLADGAYLPVDPREPEERRERLLDQIGVERRLDEEAIDEILTVSSSRLDALPEPKASEWTFDQPAYVISTSGSTGQPKGVRIGHRALASFVMSAIQIYDFTERDRVLQFASFSFDASVEEIYPALLVGARLVLAPETRPSASELVRLACRESLTVLDLPTAYWHALARGEAICPESVRLLIIGGEAARGDAVLRFVERQPHVRLVNTYGPTEGTVVASIVELDVASNRLAEMDRVPIGRPLPGKRLYLVDQQCRPVPPGTVGEILIGGGLASDYVARPALTARSFVPDPFTDRLGARLYRSGDLARQLADGRLVFVGRKDRQVKLRGFRVEPGEVEAALRQHPALTEAAVKMHHPAGSEARLVAYVVASKETAPTVGEVQAFLRQRLPAHQIPSLILTLAELPLDGRGKLDRSALPEPSAERPRLEASFVAPETELEQRLAGYWREVLGVDQVGLQDPFFELGGDSLRLLQVHERIVRDLDPNVPVLDLFRFPTLAALTEHLRSRQGGEARPNLAERVERLGRGHRSAEVADGAIAILSMAGRFPGARDVDAFWRNLRDGVESITFLSDEELLAAGVAPEMLEDPNYVKASPMLDDVDRFDAGFFDISPREAEILDPQQRVFLEVAWEALERAGYAGAARSVGVFASCSSSTYLMRHLYSRPDVMQAVGWFPMYLANDRDYFATRVSYKLNLRGPSINVQTACSSSLTAIHLARQSLLDGECELALAGGVRVWLPQDVGYNHQPGGISSPDGHCRSFDAGGNGSVFGNGVGVVVLKRLADALADGDPIAAVLRGSALNNDGSFKVGYTAPSVEGQAEVIALAHREAGVDPSSLSYIETHGSGTPLGDPIEVAALQEAFGTGEPGSCAIGSVKSNFGHLESAAGVAGLIKTVLALEHQQIPPSLNCSEPNPKIDFEQGPFFVNTELRDWTSEEPRRAGVSSFGIGGTNVHLVVEEAPTRSPSDEDPRPQLLVLSAPNERALDALSDRLAEDLADRPTHELADVAFTLQNGRRSFAHRRLLVTGDPESAAQALRERRPDSLLTGRARDKAPRVAFLLPGLGDLDVGAGRELYEREPVFRSSFDEAAEILEPYGFDPRDFFRVTAPKGGFKALLKGRAESPEAKIWRRTERLHPVLFTFEIGLARLWKSWGIEPDVLLGYSLGELAAACRAEVMTFHEGLRFVAERARLIAEQPPGAMLAVSLAADRLAPFLGNDVVVSARNGPEMTVMSGPEEAIEACEERLVETFADGSLVTRRLSTGHAFHHPSLKTVGERLTELARRIDWQAPKVPYLSNVTGDWILPGTRIEPESWARHLVSPVRFDLGLEKLWQEDRLILELGAGLGLGAVALQHPLRPDGTSALPSLPAAHEERGECATLLGSLGRLWLAGVEPHWAGVHGERRRRRLTLPTYPFALDRFWIDPAPQQGQAMRSSPLLARLQSGPWAEAVPEPATWIVFASGATESVLSTLEASGSRVLRVEVENGEESEESGWTLRPEVVEGYRKLLATADVQSDEERPVRLLHAWSLDGPTDGSLRALAERDRLLGQSLLALLQALAERAHPVRLDLWTSGEVGAVEASLDSLRQAATVELSGLDWQTLIAEPEAFQQGADFLLGELAQPATELVVWQGERRLSTAPRRADHRDTLTLHARPALGRAYEAPRNPREERIAGVWQNLLGVAEIGVHDSFFEMGGHSLLAPQLVLKLGEAFDVELPLALLFQAPTIAELAIALEKAESNELDAWLGGEELDLRAEIELDPSLQADGEAELGPAQVVFLTGATGFVGVYLLAELLRQPSIRVHCLARAEDDTAAGERIRQQLERYELLSDGFQREAFDHRVIAHAGDLAEPRLGLPESKFDRLAEEVDTIYHAGAWVNFTYPYAALAPSNVEGTREALRLAFQARVKPFHFVSSVAVFASGSVAEDGRAYEDSTLEGTDDLFSGYAESKWVAEHIVRLAAQRGLPITIHRPGIVGGHSQTGHGNPRDMAWALLKGSIELGLAFDSPVVLNATPIDHVVEAMVHICTQPSSRGRAFHYPNPDPATWTDVFNTVKAMGYAFDVEVPARWREALDRVAQEDGENALIPFLPILPRPEDFDPTDEVGAEHQPPDMTSPYDDTNTRAGLAESSIVCPPVDERLIRLYVRAFVADGYLPPPEASDQEER